MKIFTLILVGTFLGFFQLQANELRIEPDALSQNLNNYTILDTRDSTKYTSGHIKGALHFPINLTYENKKLNGKLINPITMQKIVRGLGLDVDSNIVVYDDGAFFDASRLFWSLEVYGFKNVKLLNIGYQGWKSKNYLTSKTSPSIKMSKYIAKVNNKRLATKFSTQIASRNPKQIIVDARDIKAYNGEVSSAKRYGHIPSAIHIPATHNINYKDDISKIKSLDKLQKLYSSIDKNQKVIMYCAIGKIASTGYFTLRELGYEVANYDASWREWGNDENLPVTNPSQK